MNIFYRPQTKFAKVMFLQVSVCPRVGGGGAWQGGVCGGGGMHSRGVCVARGAGVAGGWWGVCMAGGCPPPQILRDTVNERAVRILLECILVVFKFLLLLKEQK